MTYQIQAAKGTTTRLTVTPTRVTIKLPYNTDSRYQKRVESFVGYVLEQFTSPIKDEWRGTIKFEREGVLLGSVVLHSGSKVRKYEAIV